MSEVVGVKIVGKIDLPKVEKRDDPYRVYLHFAERLNERYGLQISKKEYTLLCNEKFEILADRPGKNLKVKLIFKGKEILAIRKKGIKTLLVTALPKYGDDLNK